MRPETKITLHNLSIKRKGADYVIGYEPTRNYITVDKEGLAVIKDLQKHAVGDVQTTHKDKDVKTIIAQLTENGLVHKIGHRVINPKKPVQDILDIPAKNLTWIHRPLTRGTLLGISVIALILLLTQPHLTPSPEWFFATPWLSLLIPGAFILAWALHFLHEIGHYATIKATGYPTGFHLTHRWHLLVPEADLTNATHLTPPQQTRVYLAGLAVDITLFTIALLFILLGIATPFWQLIALIIWVSMLVQILPLAYTDATKIAERITKRTDVLWQARQSLKSLCVFCKHHDNKHRALRANLLPWMVAGILTGITIILAYIIPILYTVIQRATQTLLATRQETALIVDASLALLLIALFTSLYAVATIREHHLGTKNWFTWLSVALFITANFVVVFLLGLTLELTTNPLITTTGFLLLGGVFGSLFLLLMDHIHIEKTGFATDTLLPIYAASTALLLVLVFAATPHTQQTETIYGIAYAVGMLASLAS